MQVETRREHVAVMVEGIEHLQGSRALRRWAAEMLEALLSERDAATARAEFLRKELDLQLDNLDATKRALADLERHFAGMLKQRDAATAERDALRDEWEEIAAGITTEQPEVGALWPMVSEISGNLAAARNLFRNEARAHNHTKAERDRLREALEIIAGYRQCMDNLMSNVDVARAALAGAAKEAVQDGE